MAKDLARLPHYLVLAATAAAVIVCTVAGGYLVARASIPLLHDRYAPWIIGRALGLAALAALLALVLVGLWLHHPWRGVGRIHPESIVKIHAALGAAVPVLLAGHITSLVLDRYAGVGWVGAVVPGFATYRPLPVALGVVAAWCVALVAGTAGIASRLVGRAWRPLHRLALPAFALAWLHGLFAGSDGSNLRVYYAVSAGLVCLMAASHALPPRRQDPAWPEHPR